MLKNELILGQLSIPRTQCKSTQTSKLIIKRKIRHKFHRHLDDNRKNRRMLWNWYNRISELARNLNYGVVLLFSIKTFKTGFIPALFKRECSQQTSFVWRTAACVSNAFVYIWLLNWIDCQRTDTDCICSDALRRCYRPRCLRWRRLESE